MEDYCLTHRFDKNPNFNKDNFAFVLVDDRFKLIYCAIPKVASTTMREIFAQLYNKTWRGLDVSITSVCDKRRLQTCRLAGKQGDILL